MLDAVSDRRTAALLVLGGIAVATLCVAVTACSDRNEPSATSFTKVGGQLLVRAKNIRWSPAPATLPVGAKAALLQGDPNEAGRYVIRVQLPPNYKIPFHAYTNAMDVTVVSGTLYVANTATFDKKRAFAIKPGDFYHLPAGAPQFTYTKGETVLEIHGDGPLKLSYTSPTDDPLKGAAPGRYSFTAAYVTNDMNDAEAAEVIDLTY
jgi:quercetin dioxygenase-like cupin family protein